SLDACGPTVDSDANAASTCIARVAAEHDEVRIARDVERKTMLPKPVDFALHLFDVLLHRIDISAQLGEVGAELVEQLAKGRKVLVLDAGKLGLERVDLGTQVIEIGLARVIPHLGR